MKDHKRATGDELHSESVSQDNSAAVQILDRIDRETDLLLEVLMQEGPGPMVVPPSELKVLREGKGSGKAGLPAAKFVRDQAMAQFIDAATALRKAISAVRCQP